MLKLLALSFSDIFFVDTNTIETIDTGLKNIAIAKHAGNSCHDALQWLVEKPEEWLLFFDNANDPKIDLNGFIPPCDHGNIIITSQNPELCVYAGAHSCVSEMDDTDAVLLLLKSAAREVSPQNQVIATKIVKVRLIMVRFIKYSTYSKDTRLSSSGNNSGWSIHIEV